MGRVVVQMFRPGISVGSLLRRMRTLTVRQTAVLVVAVVLGIGIAMAAMAEFFSLATTLAGLMSLLTLLAVLQLRRRMSQEIRSVNLQNAQLVKRVEATQRRILAALEHERLAAAERQRALLVALSEGDMTNEAAPRRTNVS